MQAPGQSREVAKLSRFVEFELVGVARVTRDAADDTRLHNEHLKCSIKAQVMVQVIGGLVESSMRIEMSRM